MSASISPTRWPSRARAAARLAETVDFPTPPLPDEIARAAPRLGCSIGVGGGGTPPRAAAPAACAAPARAAPPSPVPPPESFTLIVTAVTPGTSFTVLRASRTSVPASSRASRNVNVTAPPPSTARSFTIPAERTSLATRGLEMLARARSTCALSVLEAATGGNVPARAGRGQREREPRCRSAGFPMHEKGERPALAAVRLHPGATASDARARGVAQGLSRFRRGAGHRRNRLTLQPQRHRFPAHAARRTTTVARPHGRCSAAARHDGCGAPRYERPGGVQRHALHPSARGPGRNRVHAA